MTRDEGVLARQKRWREEREEWVRGIEDRRRDDPAAFVRDPKTGFISLKEGR